MRDVDQGRCIMLVDFGQPFLTQLMWICWVHGQPSHITCRCGMKNTSKFFQKRLPGCSNWLWLATLVHQAIEDSGHSLDFGLFLEGHQPHGSQPACNNGHGVESVCWWLFQFGPVFFGKVWAETLNGLASHHSLQMITLLAHGFNSLLDVCLAVFWQVGGAEHLYQLADGSTCPIFGSFQLGAQGLGQVLNEIATCITLAQFGQMLDLFQVVFHFPQVGHGWA